MELYTNEINSGNQNEVNIFFIIPSRKFSNYGFREKKLSDEELMKSFQSVRPDKPHKCTWKPKTTEISPHNHDTGWVSDLDTRASFKALLVLRGPKAQDRSAALLIYRTSRPKILPNILHAIGNTPMIRLNKIPKEEGIQCEMGTYIRFTEIIAPHWWWREHTFAEP